MKSLVFGILALLSASSLFSQTVATPVDSLFIVTFTTGPTWDSMKGPGEQIHFKEHSANLGAWRKEGIIRFGARYADKGIIIIGSASMAAARKLIHDEEGVSSGLFAADIQKLSPFYFGCIEKPN